MKITTVGIDLAKNVFQVHGVDEHGKVMLKRQLKRDQVATFFVNLPPCLIGMEACGSAHHWARKLQTIQDSAKNRNQVDEEDRMSSWRPRQRSVSVKSIFRLLIELQH